MSSIWGNQLKISLFGESHGAGIGVVLDGLPSGYLLDDLEIQRFLDRRSPGRHKHTSQRKEEDRVQILSGVYQNRTTGTPLAGILGNMDIRPEDYQQLPPRPSHGDYTGLLRYQGFADPRGGGHFSGRLTAPLVFAGGVAKQILKQAYGTIVGGSIRSIYTVEDHLPDPVTEELLREVSQREFPVFSLEQGEKMKAEIEKVMAEQDSVGGIVECTVLEFPSGMGSPIFQGLENKLSSLLFGIPGVRGVEFGTGFEATKLKGSQHNDPFILKDDQIQTVTNHHGGILGGISSGMPITLRVAFKPTPSIGQTQQSVDLSQGKEIDFFISGRHDPCIVPRGVPVVEAAVALGLLDAALEGGLPHATGGMSKEH